MSTGSAEQFRNPAAVLDSSNAALGPFADRADGDFLYTSEDFTQKTRTLFHLLEYTDLIICLSGPRGMGKTTLLNFLIDENSEDWRCAYMDGRVPYTAGLFYTEVASAFSIKTGGGLLRAEDLRESLNTLKVHQYLPVLMLDNAESLSPDILDLLLPLIETGDNDDAEPGLRLILAIDSEQEEILSVLQEKLRDAENLKRVPLMPLDDEQCRAYILQRLEIFGLEPEPPFTEGNIARIYKASQGIPARINQIALSLMEQHDIPVASTRPRQALQPWTLRLIVTVAVLFVASSVFWIVLQPASKPSTPTADNLQPVVTRLPLPARQSADREDPAAVAVGSGSGPIRRRTAADPGNTALTDAPTTTPGAGLPTPVESVADETTLPTAASPKVAAHSPVATPVDEPPLSPDLTRHLAWLYAQDKSAWTLQLLGAGRESSVADYIRQHRLENQAHYVISRRQGKAWYSLVYGLYSSRAEARAQAARLPRALRGSEPWIRRLGDIQTEVERDLGDR